MNYREVELVPEKTVGDSGTETVDINVTDPITCLYVDMKVKNTTDISIDVPPERIISRIEIVDGGKVYWSTAGLEAVAASCYERKEWPACWYDETLSADQNIYIPLQFGRYLGDEVFSFNPKALLNPQLKVTWSKDSEHVSGGVRLGVMAKVMQGVPAAGKALMVKSIRTFNTASSGEEPTDLPTDRTIRRLFVGCELTGVSPYQLISNYKLDCDAGKLIVFDMGQDKFLNRCQEEFGRFHYRNDINASNGRSVRTWLGKTFGAALQHSGITHFCHARASANDFVYVSVATIAGAAANDQEMVLWVMGVLPQYFAAYNFGRPDVPETWFNPGLYGQVRLLLDQATADATARILLQQVVRIP